MIAFGLIGLVVVIAIITMALGGIGGAPHCGEDVDCYLEKAKECEPVALTMADSSSTGGITMSYSSTIEVKGGTPEECDVLLRVDKLDITGDIPDMFKDQIDQLKEIEGKSRTCTVDTSTMTENVPMGVPTNEDDCSGDTISMP